MSCLPATSVRQHDAGGTNGHIPYMEYIYNNLSLPKVTMTGVNQNYHPPLHYILCAAWLKLQTLLGGEGFYACAVENIQILTLFYSSAAMLVSRSLFRLLGLNWPRACRGSSDCRFPPDVLYPCGQRQQRYAQRAFSPLFILTAWPLVPRTVAQGYFRRSPYAWDWG